MKIMTFKFSANTIKHLIYFGMAGGIAFGVDVGVLKLLMVLFGMPPLLARVASIMMAMVVAWVFNRTFTFKVKSTPTIKEFLRYAALAWSVAALNYIVFAGLVLVGVFSSTILCAALATGVSMVASYFGMRFGVFKHI